MNGDTNEGHGNSQSACLFLSDIRSVAYSGNLDAVQAVRMRIIIIKGASLFFVKVITFVCR